MLAKIRCIRLSGKRASMKAQKALEAAMPSTRWDQRKTVSRVTAQSKTKKAVSAQAVPYTHLTLPTNNRV